MHQKGRKKKNSRPDLWDESEAASLRGATHIRYQRVPFVPSVAEGDGIRLRILLQRRPSPAPVRGRASSLPGRFSVRRCAGLLCVLNAVLTTWNYIRNFHVRQVVQENAVTFSREKAAFMEKQPLGVGKAPTPSTEMQALRLLHYLSPKTALFTFKGRFQEKLPLPKIKEGSVYFWGREYSATPDPPEPGPGTNISAVPMLVAMGTLFSSQRRQM